MELKLISASMHSSCHYTCFAHVILINFTLLFGRLYVVFLLAWIVCNTEVDFERGMAGRNQNSMMPVTIFTYVYRVDFYA